MPSLLDLLGQTWPARMGKSMWEAAKLPGDVYAGRVDPLSEEGIGRSADLAGMVMGGTYAGAPAGAVGAGAVKPIRAYHGSPHDFDRFDLSKIGTGEGAQAYGHGLYFAENPAVAEEYKKTLAGKHTSIMRTPLVKEAAAELGSSSKYLPDAILRELETGTPLDQVASRMSMDPLNRGRTPEEIQRAVDYVTTKYPQHKAIPGRMYEVNINAAPEQFLDWDKMVAQQQAGVKVPGIYGPTQTGEGFYRALEIAKHQPNRGHLDRQAASEFLREAGIPGIKYLDQGSRFNQALYNDNPIAKEALKFVEAAGGNSEKAAEAFYKSNPVDRWAVPERDEIRRLIQMSGNKPTSNYVLFRDDIIDIVKKYGLAGAAAMFGISQDEAKAAMDNPKDKKMSIGRQTYGDEE